MAVSAANLGGVADPRLNTESDDIGKGRHGSVAAIESPRGRRLSNFYNNSEIQFEEYNYWAQQSREYEKGLDTKGAGLQGAAKLLMGKGIHKDNAQEVHDRVANELQDVTLNNFNKEIDNVNDRSVAPATNGGGRFGISESEWENAQRATRTATWGSIFYLITTDILGPYNVPWAIAQMGYGPGAALYIVFGGFAFYSGLQLWQQFVGLDSTRYPLRNYGDLAFRVYGNWARVGVNALQSFQFFLNVVLIIESNGQGLAQMAAGASGTGFLCFVVAEVIFMICGFILGQIRTLQRLSYLANLAIWLNVFVIFMTMAVTSVYGPNEQAANISYDVPLGQPIMTSAYWPEGSTLIDHINGLMNGVFAYGGATLFNELMVEMRRPMDFWKGFLCAEIFIFAVYITMGMVIYTAQGQYTYTPAYQGIPTSAYAWQTVGNAVSLISALIAALLYGNIGIKVFYAAVLRDVFKFPSLDQKAGKFIWIACVPIYWGLAMVVAGALPQVANLTSFVGAACILQFSYTFPPILKVGYNCQKDAILPDEGFDPMTGQATRVDSGFKRWMRGYRQKLFINTFDMIYFVGALATAGLGIYASVIGMHDTFIKTPITPFTCQNPAG